MGGSAKYNESYSPSKNIKTYHEIFNISKIEWFLCSGGPIVDGMSRYHGKTCSKWKSHDFHSWLDMSAFFPCYMYSTVQFMVISQWKSKFDAMSIFMVGPPWVATWGSLGGVVKLGWWYMPSWWIWISQGHRDPAWWLLPHNLPSHIFCKSKIKSAGSSELGSLGGHIFFWKLRKIHEIQ